MVANDKVDMLRERLRQMRTVAHIADHKPQCPTNVIVRPGGKRLRQRLHGHRALVQGEETRFTVAHKMHDGRPEVQ